MEELKKKYLFVKKVRVSDEYKTYIVTRHYEKELTEDELAEEIKIFKANILSVTLIWK